MKLLFESDGKISILEKIIIFLAKTGNVPRAYGVFHILSLIVIFAICAIIIVKRRRFTKKSISVFVFACGIIMLVLEIYKQLVITYEVNTDEWVYELYAFPFQFCSTPTYIALLSFLFYKLKIEKVYNALLSFLATYGMIASIVVLFIGTQTVFCTYIGINLQTMIHHGLMFIISVAILCTDSVALNKKSLTGAFVVFIPLLVIALILNKCIDGLDLFYVSPNSTFVYKQMSDILFGGKLPYPVYLIGYIVLFTLGSALILRIVFLIKNHNKKTD